MARDGNKGGRGESQKLLGGGRACRTSYAYTAQDIKLRFSMAFMYMHIQKQNKKQKNLGK